MKPRYFALPLALLLLAGCGAPAAESPSPSAAPSESTAPTEQPSAPGISVATHWDVLTDNAAEAPRRWPGCSDDLVPGDDYGQLVPYLGGEANAQYWGGSGYWGLATRDGTLVTDPVFLEINVLSYYDAEHQRTEHQPVLILRKGGKNADGSLSNLYGVAAADGSWYTGLKYSALVTQSSAGIFLLEKSGDAVMLAPDGQERWRWAADEIPLDNLTPQELYWDYSSIGQWMQCTVSWNDDGTAGNLYVDLLTGEVTDTVPDVYDPDAQFGSNYDENAVYYGEGWYECDEDTHTLTIHPDGGSVHTIDISGYSPYPNIDGDRVIFSLESGGSLITDLDGNVLFRTENYLNFAWQSYDDTSSLVYYYGEDIANEDGTYDVTYVVLDRDGNELFTCRDYYLIQFGDRVIFADDTSYRMTDLAGHDILRLSRWELLDFPADD